MEKKLIIFDMDGTLVNSSLTIANAINYVRKNLGFEPMAQEYILRLVNDHTINPAQTFYHAKAFDRDHEKWFSEYYTKNHQQELILYDGIKELLDTLKGKGHDLAVATNAYRGSTIESLTHLEVYEHFDAIACYDDVQQGKPHPDMLHKILDELGHSSHSALFIGDGPRDELASKRAEIDYIMVDWGFTDHIDAVRSVDELHTLLLR
ncbi:HAD family hydrolase [Sulfurovum sp. TSL1]|uniref:HAD family hydrolase n=1 Tax=Sulfurovum sp. TSL1 TaxID=2826994 RepID=UPI001CC3FF2C|nr:HAD family hydrolase [Sulfurovum sp. TSL1]GIT97956.1 haloacid dehalogenase [Sulfurovum sp. TSL1]